jgi:hypothetical protein
MAKRRGNFPPPNCELPCGNRDVAPTNNSRTSVGTGIEAYKHGGIVKNGIKRPAARQGGETGVAPSIPANVLSHNAQSQLERRYLFRVSVGQPGVANAVGAG